MADMTPPRPTSKRTTITRRDELLQALADTVEAEAAAARARIEAVAACRAYTPGDGEEPLHWKDIAAVLGEPHVNHASAYYKTLLDEQVTRVVTVADDAVDRDAAMKRRRRTGHA